MEHHHHHESHAVTDSLYKIFIVCIALNLLFVFIEAIVGFVYNSLGLLSDAGHNLSDVFSLMLALIAFRLARHPASLHFTYGYKKATILISLLNAVILLVAVGAIVIESVYRLRNATDVSGEAIGWTAGAGIVINGLTTWLLMKDRKADLNVNGAFLHMLMDTLVSVGVVVSGVIISFTDWVWIDSAVSLVIAVIILVSVVLNIGLDLALMLGLGMGVEGAAWATVIAQTVAAIGLYAYTRSHFPELRLSQADRVTDFRSIRRIASYSFLTCVQQSVMNFGILMVQGLVNTFGTAVMAAFAAAVKIDSFAYMPVQDFGNAFSTFIAQNYGAGRHERIRRGIRSAVVLTTVFALLVSAAVFVLSPWLMSLFVPPSETGIIAIGVEYLRIEGSFYVGIGYLFLLYGFYRAVALPSMSVVLTVISLGSRVLLAYVLAAIPSVGYTGIWWSVPIGWALADVAGVWYYRRKLADRLRPTDSTASCSP